MSSQFIVKVLLRLIRFYQLAISPILPARCRFYPTCSCYAIDALYWYNLKGLILIARRVLRCHPFGGHGVDFVPIPLWHFYFVPSQYQRGFIFLDRQSYTWYLGKRFGIKG